jgi:hypothetical protein
MGGRDHRERHIGEVWRTRKRIVQATMKRHEEVAPARTTIA